MKPGQQASASYLRQPEDSQWSLLGPRRQEDTKEIRRIQERKVENDRPLSSSQFAAVHFAYF